MHDGVLGRGFTDGLRDHELVLGLLELPLCPLFTFGVVWLALVPEWPPHDSSPSFGGFATWRRA